jgi:hypothetical protein
MSLINSKDIVDSSSDWVINNVKGTDTYEATIGFGATSH